MPNTTTPAQKRAYYERNYALCLERAKQQRAKPGHDEHMKPIKRRSMLKKRYGITDTDYYALLAAQRGGCAICGTTSPNNGHKNTFFDVDHDHVTGKVRGLLCRDCNVTVGVIEKKTDKIKLIKEYLAKHVEYDPKEPVPAEV